MVEFYDLFGKVIWKNSHAKNNNQFFSAIKYGLLKFKFLLTNLFLSYLAVRSQFSIREISMGPCETSDFSSFTFSSTTDMRFCTHTYQSCLSHGGIYDFGKWWYNTDTNLQYYISLITVWLIIFHLPFICSTWWIQDQVWTAGKRCFNFKW